MNILEDKELLSIIDGLITEHINESEIIEYKVDFYDPAKIGKYVSALSNVATMKDEKRAFLFWGIENDTLKVLGSSFNPLEKKVHNESFIAWLSQVTNGCEFEFRNVEYEGKNIVILIVPAAKWVETKFKGTAYIRVDSTTPALDDYPEKKRLLWSKLVRESFEDEIAMATITPKDIFELLDYSIYYKMLKLEIPTDEETILHMLESEGCISRESTFSKYYSITNLGAMLFAKNIEKFKELKNKSIRVIKYEGINRLNATVDRTFHRGYGVGFFELLDFLKDILPSKEVFDNGVRERISYPDIILRELIPNMMIHQDFLIKGQQPRIEIFDDRIELLNAGEPLIPTNRFLDMAPISRNEALARLMHKLRICEERGSGIDRVFQAIELHKMPATVFKSENFSVTAIAFLNKPWENYTKEDKINVCYQHCCYLYYLEQQPMTNQSLRERINLGNKNHAIISRVIADARNAKLIKPTSENSKKYIPFWA